MTQATRHDGDRSVTLADPQAGEHNETIMVRVRSPYGVLPSDHGHAPLGAYVGAVQSRSSADTTQFSAHDSLRGVV